MTSSSTSSSKPLDRWARGGTALGFVVGFLVLTELVLRLIEPHHLIPYEPGPMDRIASRERVRAYGPPDIAFFGSSRSHSAWMVPAIQAEMKAHGKDLRIENYATGGGTGLETSYFVRWMLRRGPPPGMVVVEAVPEDLYKPDVPNDMSAYYWTLADWWEERGRGLEVDVDKWFGTVVRNHFAEHLAIFRYRDRPLNMLKNLAHGYLTMASPVSGDYEQHEHLDRPDERIGALDYDGLKDHIETHHLTNGRLEWSEARAQRLVRMLVALREAGSEVVFIEVPVTPFFRSGFPPGASDAFTARWRKIADEAGVEFVSGQALGQKLQQAEHFRDANHVNRAGAQIASEWITEEVLLPRLGPHHAFTGSP